jgi:hypothetical protein
MPMRHPNNLKMQKIYLLFILSLTTFFCFSQQTYKVTYGQLKEFEGLYEYANKTTLKIAASPKDTLLYAVINESKYKLTPSGKDLFLNMSNENVLFFRNKAKAIAGYITGKDTFKLLSKNVFFPKTIWYL